MNISNRDWKSKTTMYVVGGVLAFSIATLLVNRNTKQEKVIKPLAQVCQDAINKVQETQQKLLDLSEGDDPFYYTFKLDDYSVIDYELQGILRKRSFSQKTVENEIMESIERSRDALRESLLRLNLVYAKPGEMTVQTAIEMQRKCAANVNLPRPIWLKVAMSQANSQYEVFYEDLDSKILSITGKAMDSVAKLKYPESIVGKLDFVSAELELFKESQWSFNALYITNEDDRGEFFNRLRMSDEEVYVELFEKLGGTSATLQSHEWLFVEQLKSVRLAVLLRKMWQEKPQVVDFVTACELVTAHESKVAGNNILYPSWFILIWDESHKECMELCEPFTEAHLEPSDENLDLLVRLRHQDEVATR